MEPTLSLEDFNEIAKLLPQLLRNKLINAQFAPSVFKVIQEELTMEEIQSLHAELFCNKTLRDKSFTSFSEFLSKQSASENADQRIYTRQFIGEMQRLEDLVKEAVTNFKKYSGKLLTNINLMLDDHKNQVIEKVVYDRIRPFENLKTIFNMRYAFISGMKDRNALYEDLKSELGPWLQAKITANPERVTLKEFNLYYNQKTLKTDLLFSELIH